MFKSPEKFNPTSEDPRDIKNLGNEEGLGAGKENLDIKNREIPKSDKLDSRKEDLNTRNRESEKIGGLEEKTKQLEKEALEMKDYIFELRAKIKEQEERIIQLEKEVTIDSLTGLLNRKGFDSQLKKEVSIHDRLGSKLELLYLDLNNLKEINDTFGHIAGDNLILKLTKSIKENIRPSDFAGRVGGDEFIIILTQIEESIADAIMERIKEGKIKEEETYSVAVGSSLYDGGNRGREKSIEEVKKEAEARMYEDKRRAKRKEGKRRIEDKED